MIILSVGINEETNIIMLNFSLFNERAKNFNCPKCSSDQSMTYAMIPSHSNTATIACKCKGCKFIEFYDYYVLDRNFKSS